MTMYGAFLLAWGLCLAGIWAFEIYVHIDEWLFWRKRERTTVA